MYPSPAPGFLDSSLSQTVTNDRSDIFYFCGKIPNAAKVASMLQADSHLVNKRADSWPHGSPVHFAAREGNMEVLKLLLEAGADANLLDGLGRTALNKAARQGRVQAVCCLIEGGGADFRRVDGQNRTLLHDCALCPDPAMQAEVLTLLRYLIDDKGLDPLAKDATGRDPLEVALQLDPPQDMGVLRELYGRCCTGGIADAKRIWLRLAREAKVRAMAALLDCLPDGAQGDILLSSRDHGQRTCLHLVAKHGKAEAVRQLLEWGADPLSADLDGNLPLHLSVLHGHEEAFKMLLDDRSEGARNTEGQSPLQVALCSQRFRLADWLIERRLRRKESLEAMEVDGGGNNLLLQAVSGQVPERQGPAPLPQPRGGQWPLHCAVVAHSHEMAEALILAGADIHALDSGRQTALHVAADCLDESMVALLLRYRADPMREDLSNRTAVDCARRAVKGREQPEIRASVIAMLENAALVVPPGGLQVQHDSTPSSGSPPVPTIKSSHPRYRLLEQIYPVISKSSGAEPPQGATEGTVVNSNSYVFVIECLETFDASRHVEGQGMQAQQPYVLKCAPTEQKEKVRMLVREVEFSDALKALSSEARQHFCDLYASGQGWIAGMECHYIVTEYCTLRDLASHIREVSTGITEEQVLRLSQQLSSALVSLHSELKRVHLDLKPENIALKSEQGWLHVKVLDLGISQKVFSASGGAVNYATYYDSATNAPEQYGDSPRVTVKTDVYKLGVVMMQLACRQLMDDICRALPYDTTGPRYHYLKDVPPAVLRTAMERRGVRRPELTGLILRMLHADPDLRPTMSEVDEALRGLLPPRLRTRLATEGEEQEEEEEAGSPAPSLGKRKDRSDAAPVGDGHGG